MGDGGKKNGRWEIYIRVKKMEDRGKKKMGDGRWGPQK